jgi:hypothetical protein
MSGFDFLFLAAFIIGLYFGVRIFNKSQDDIHWQVYKGAIQIPMGRVLLMLGFAWFFSSAFASILSTILNMGSIIFMANNCSLSQAATDLSVVNNCIYQFPSSLSLAIIIAIALWIRRKSHFGEQTGPKLESLNKLDLILIIIGFANLANQFIVIFISTALNSIMARVSLASINQNWLYVFLWTCMFILIGLIAFLIDSRIRSDVVE